MDPMGYIMSFQTSNKRELVWLIFEGHAFIHFVVGNYSHGFWESSPVMYQSVQWDGDDFCLFSFFVRLKWRPDQQQHPQYIYIYNNRIYHSHVQLIPPSSSHPYPSRLAETHLNRQSAEKLLGLEVSGGKKNVPWPHEGFGVFFQT